jgi:hypothetical protein
VGVEQRAVTGGGDPFEQAQSPISIVSECLTIPPPPAGNVPVGVDNWEFFDGSLLAVGFIDEDIDNDVLDIQGSAVMIAPGLAISVKHTFKDWLAVPPEGRKTVYCAGLRASGHADIWLLEDMTYEGEGDLAILSLRLVSGLPHDGRFSSLPLTARTPRRGEKLTIVGFRFEPGETVVDPATGVIDATGQLYTAVGEVNEVYWPIRDTSFAPFPCIEVLCGSKGAMSGGAVIDRDGGVIGAVSTGFDGGGLTLAAWCVHAFGWRVTQLWPPKLYPPDTPLATMPLIRIREPQFLRIDAAGNVRWTMHKPV